MEGMEAVNELATCNSLDDMGLLVELMVDNALVAVEMVAVELGDEELVANELVDTKRFGSGLESST